MGEEASVGLSLYAEGYHQGLEKAKTGMRSFEGQTNRSLGNTQRSFDGVAKSTNMGAEKITKYGTAVNALAGNTSLLGVKNDALAKSIAVVSDAMSGMMSGVGLAVVGIGALAAGIGYLIAEQERLKKAANDATKSLLDQAAVKGIGGVAEAFVLAGSEKDLLEERAKLTARLAEIQEGVNRGVLKYKTSGWEVALSDDAAGARDLSIQLWSVRKQLDEVNEAIEKHTKARWAGRTLPPIDVTGQRPGKAPAGNVPGVPSGGEMYGPNSILSQLRMGSWAQPGADSPDIARQIAEPHLTANELIRESYDQMSMGVQAAYQGMHGTIRGLTMATSQIVEAALMREDLGRLKGLDVLKFVTAQGAAAALRALAQVAEKKALDAAAEGFLALVKRTGIPMYGFKAAAMFGLLAGGAYGAANAIERSSQLKIGESAKQAGYDSTPAGSGGSGGFSSSGGWGAQVAPTTVTYAPQLIINGNAYFGSDADRELARRLIPMLEQAMALRSN